MDLPVGCRSLGLSPRLLFGHLLGHDRVFGSLPGAFDGGVVGLALWRGHPGLGGDLLVSEQGGLILVRLGCADLVFRGQHAVHDAAHLVGQLDLVAGTLRQAQDRAVHAGQPGPESAERTGQCWRRRFALHQVGLPGPRPGLVLRPGEAAIFSAQVVADLGDVVLDDRRRIGPRGEAFHVGQEGVAGLVGEGRQVLRLEQADAVVLGLVAAADVALVLVVHRITAGFAHQVEVAGEHLGLGAVVPAHGHLGIGSDSFRSSNGSLDVLAPGANARAHLGNGS